MQCHYLLNTPKSMLFALNFNQLHEYLFTNSIIFSIYTSLLLKSFSFLAFQILQMHVNQITLNMPAETLPPWINPTNWSRWVKHRTLKEEMSYRFFSTTLTNGPLIDNSSLAKIVFCSYFVLEHSPNKRRYFRRNSFMPSLSQSESDITWDPGMIFLYVPFTENSSCIYLSPRTH